MKSSFYHFFTISAILLLLFSTQAMNGTLGLLSFDKQQLDSTISAYDTVGGNIAAKIERALQLGKPLSNFVGIKKLLLQAMAIGSDLQNVSITDSSGKLLYTIDAKRKIPNDLLPQAKPGATLSSHLQYGEEHFLFYNLMGGDEEVAGYLVLSFDNELLSQRKSRIIIQSLMVLGGCTLVAALVLTIGFLAVFRFPRLRRRRVIALFLFVVLGGAQLVCSVYNISLFQKNYLDITRTKSRTVALILKQDVEYLLQKGLKLTVLINLENQLKTTVARVPELAWLTIAGGEGQVLYRGGDVVEMADKLKEQIPLKVGNIQVGSITTGLNSQVINEAVREIVYDSLTIVALSLLVVMEFVLFLFATIIQPLTGRGLPRKEIVGNDQLMRTTIFLFIFASSLCYSFIPLYMDQIYQPIRGFSREMILGMPLAAEMLGGGLVLIPVGLWIDRRGWHQPFLLGTMLAFFGMLLSGLASNPTTFIAARALSGVGYGMAWMAAQGYVLINTHVQQRALAISNVVAGIYAGLICGNAVGALVAHRLGFSFVFILSSAMLLFVLAFVIIFMRQNFKRPDSERAVKIKERLGVIKLLADPQALLIFVCSLVPYSIVSVGLLYYVTPLYLNMLGVSQSDIGRVIMLFGLCMIFVAPYVSRFADKLEDKRGLVAAGGFLGSCSLLLFYLSGSFWIVPLSVMLFGLSVSISAASRNVIILGLPIAEKLGTSRVMGVYRSVDKIGQTLGALVAAALMTSMDVRSAMTVLGLAYLCLTLFLLVRLKKK